MNDGKIKLCDFGLVVHIGTVDSAICGTPEYMAPERLSEKRFKAKIDTAVDVWALGVLLF
jgi:serine/threonine protein kinase